MIALALCDLSRFEKGHPAPDVVGYVVTWHLLESGADPSVRRLAGDLGWGRTKAAKTLKRVKEERENWLKMTSHQEKTKTATNSGHRNEVEPAFSASLADGISQQERTESASNSLVNTITTTSTKKEDAAEAAIPSPKVAATWSRLADEWQRLKPGGRRLQLTKSRRTQLKARLKEVTADDLVIALRWMLTSTHSRARFCQDNGYGVDTLLRASKCGEYVELSQAPELDAADRFLQRMEARELVTNGVNYGR